eukprot:TRINITY_DN4395_c0_g1_i1.p1 TRINITY_DN4395_c0_g1~~TRINITY_DN4395_c0_g1_i1.p1  ORF type:complete len:805 (-),score=254.91 TRINITY_DN4395_c0_g1_i1:67-2418(-)
MGARLFLVLLVVSSVLSFRSSCHVGDQKLPFSIAFLDRAIEQIEFASKDQNTIFAVTKSSSLYFSSDSGSNWVHIDSLLPSVSVKVGGASGVKAVIPTSTDSKVWVMGKGQQIWTTVNGISFQYYSFEDKPFQSLVPNTLQSDYAFALRYKSSLCVAAGCATDLYATKDFGVTWVLIASQVYQASWINSHDLIFLSSQGESQAFPLLIEETILQRSDDLGDLYNVALNCGAFQKVDSSIYYVVENALSTQSILVTSDEFQTFQELVFPPSLDLSDLTTMNVVSQKDGSFILHLVVGDESVAFSSGKNDISMTPILIGSLSDSSCSSIRTAASIDGVLLSTTVISVSPQTLISFNQGTEWAPISLDGNDVVLTNLCQQELIEIRGVPGLMIGSGYLAGDSSKTETFLSADAGLTWKSISQEQNVLLQQTNLGSVLTLSSASEQTSVLVSVSLDEGDSWAQCTLDRLLPNGGSFKIEKIISFDDPTSTRFLITGFTSSSLSGFVISLDTLPLIPSECSQGQMKEWTVKGEDGECVLGAQTTLYKNDPSSKCHIVTIPTPGSPSICPCTPSDYECDGACFEEDENGYCINVCEGMDEDPTMQPALCDDSWSKTQGYRLVAGTVCSTSQGLDLLPVTTTCLNVVSDGPDPVDPVSYYSLPPPAPSIPTVTNDSVIVSNNTQAASSDPDDSDVLLYIFLTFAILLFLVLLVVGVLVTLWFTSSRFRDKVQSLPFMWSQKEKYGYSIAEDEEDAFPVERTPSRTSSRTLAEDIFDFSDSPSLPAPIKPN